jgi:hypothetical protein
VGTDITVTTATRPASGLGQITPEPYLSCSGLVTTPAEVAEEGSGLGGDAGLGGNLLGADGDSGLSPQCHNIARSDSDITEIRHHRFMLTSNRGPHSRSE